jgi:chitinase
LERRKLYACRVALLVRVTDATLQVLWDAPQQNVINIVDGGYNVIVLAFYLADAATDILQAWAGLNCCTLNSTIAYAHSKGAIVLATAGGSEVTPYTLDANAYAMGVVNFVQQYRLDGIDFDLEKLHQTCTSPGLTASAVIQWMVTATKKARSLLGPLAIITHAPQAPYFGAVGGSGWAGSTGCYTAVWLQCVTGTINAISWFNMQYYNQGATCYTSYTSLFVESNAGGVCPPFPGTSVSEIVSYGVPLTAMVIGKPLRSDDAGSGYVAPAQLHTYLQQAQVSLSWNAGVMVWSWHNSDGPTWIATVYPN